jgi:GNAT superfamily N-acetyltransferase
MSIQFRNYTGRRDYQLIDDFLIEHYQPDNRDGNWIEPAWEYMHHHGLLDVSSLTKIGIWEQDGRIVAVAHNELSLGEAFFQFHPSFRYLREAMLDHSEKHLVGVSRRTGKNYLCAYVNEGDSDFMNLVQSRGYKKDEERTRPVYKFDIPDPFPTIQLPDGYHLKSLADDCNWAKVNRVLWRGFDHGGEPASSEEELEDRRKMFDTPKARRDLKIVVEAPDGNFAAFCGMFYEPTHRFAYVEPVATDPEYRRLGLGRAAVLEGIRRCGVLGATIAFVGSDQAFYQAIGFKKVYNQECWLKYFD